MNQGATIHFPAPLSRSLIRLAVLAVLTTGGTSVARADILIAVAGPLSVSPMTAQYATFGEELQRGAELAVRDVNESGGINSQKLTLVIADDAGCDPKMAVEVADELARQGVVFVDGHYCSSASIPASRVYHEKRVLMISPGSTNPRLTEQGFANVFRVCGRDDVQGAFAADYVVDNKLTDGIAIVHDQSAYGKGIADEFRRRLNERGVREKMYEAIAQGDKEFGDLIAKMRNSGIQLIYFGGYFTETGLFVRQARGRGLTATMLVTSGSFNQQYWDLAGSAAEGTLMTFGPEPRKLSSAIEVVKRFEAEGFSPEGYTLYAYAAIQVFADAAKKTGSTELDELAKALHGGRFETVLGPITFDDKGDVKGFKYSMYRWHDRNYEEICCRPPGK
ncbi:branched-chain amino acid ABC transporter substrate-binding protein [Microvirga massiliensis]|uniref:branched-chain amino acid ABC transporter substrate-binding protein n=1 Tax=Microvirga massiliensis TaxID=1033741 RepID=UPI0009E3910B|nr:branched-chain amino acid ABC transporter substrate-binding protein [Microvirga massiliensis]